ncbi:MAG: hypothetical protein WAU38_07035, partial [Ignavibacteria bacterium]
MNKEINIIKFIIDFDSTFIRLEALDELCLISLKKNPDRKKILKEFRQLTNLGMQGKLSFGESLKARIKLLNASKTD